MIFKSSLIRTVSLTQKLFKCLQYSQKAIFPYEARHFFQVVYEVEKYAEFLPWCSRVDIKQRKGPEYFEAELFINFKIYEESYLSKVTAEASRDRMSVISLSNNISAFKSLKSTWIITPYQERKCQVQYNIDFEFKNIFFQTVAQMFLDTVSKTINSSFENRVKQLLASHYFDNHSTPLLQKIDKAERLQKEMDAKKEEQKKEEMLLQVNLNSSTQSQSQSNEAEKLKEECNTLNKQSSEQTDQSAREQQLKYEQQMLSMLNKDDQMIGEYLVHLIKQNKVSIEDAKKCIVIMNKSAEQREQILRAYSLFINSGEVINISKEDADIKFIQFIRSATLY